MFLPGDSFALFIACLRLQWLLSQTSPPRSSLEITVSVEPGEMFTGVTITFTVEDPLEMPLSTVKENLRNVGISTCGAMNDRFDPARSDRVTDGPLT